MSQFTTSVSMGGVLTILFATLFTMPAGAQPRHCSATAKALFQACGAETREESWVASAICRNLSDAAERQECTDQARESRVENRKFCREQLRWRQRGCRLLGEDRYDPDFDPASFEADFSNLQHANPYFPLAIGNFWQYEGAGEVNTVEVLNETKLIEGVTCVVVNDIVQENGDLVEDTDDWFAQSVDGTVWYCGEEVKDFESFDGDDPRKPELVGIDGSFKAGRDGDKPGMIFLASPAEGDTYLEEFSLTNAEDVTEILSVDYSFGSDPELDAFVPQALADQLCSQDCVVTRNFSVLEPGVEARKYYASGIGFFLEVDPESGEIIQLTDCNFDARCSTLPAP